MYIQILRPFVNWWYRKHPPEMVKWWKTQEKVLAKLISTEAGGYQMLLKGEKYPQPNYPRGHILFGRMSKLKHAIKNEIFNHTWALLDQNVEHKDIMVFLKKKVLPEIFALAESMRYDMLPAHRLSPSIRELWRAWSEVEKSLEGERLDRCRRLKEITCFILQEDDAYRFRFQWVAGFFNPNAWWRKIFGRNWQKAFDYALSLAEHAEVVGDMKERQRLFRRIIMSILADPETKETFEKLMSELDWKKVSLSKADKYYFRGKYFKVDYPYFSY